MEEARAQFHMVARANDSAEKAFHALLAYVEREGKCASMVYHLGEPILMKYFNHGEVEKATLKFALLDQHNENEFLANKARSIIDSLNQKSCFNSFITELSKTGTAILKASNSIYLAQKIKRNKYQVSVFLKGVGLIRNTKHNSIEEMLDTSMIGAGIPVYAENLSKNEYQKIKKEFI